MRPLLNAVVLAVAAITAGCSSGGDPIVEPDATPEWDGPPQLVTTCAWLDNPDPPPAEVGDTCTISDWEHDFTCTFVGPEEIWLCCGYSPTSGVLCQYGECPTDVGAPCCGGTNCVDGRWQ